MNTTNEAQQQGPPRHPGPQCGCPQCVYRRAYVDPPTSSFPGLPAPDRPPGPPCSVCGRTWEQHQGYTCRRPGRYAPSVWLGIGFVWAIVSGIVWAYTDANANTCKNALVGALDQSQCTTVTFWHDIAGISVLLAILTIIFAGIAMARRSN